MREFVRVGYSKDKLLRLNQVRLDIQVLFLLDILGALGKGVCGNLVTRGWKLAIMSVLILQ